MSSGQEIAKRIFDVIVSAVLILTLSWLLVLIWLLVRCTSRGRALFIQDRAGRGGRVFRMLKFRTMRAGHVHDPDPAIVISPDDQAVTPVGRLLRKYKLDELPQLFNVLAGQMSLVGPRPTVPEQVAEYDDFQRRRLEVLPGITGLAQVNGDTALSWGERIEWDAYYVEHRSFWLDLKLLAMTPLVLLTGAGRRARRLSTVHPEEAPGQG